MVGMGELDISSGPEYQTSYRCSLIIYNIVTLLYRDIPVTEGTIRGGASTLKLHITSWIINCILLGICACIVAYMLQLVAKTSVISLVSLGLSGALRLQ